MVGSILDISCQFDACELYRNIFDVFTKYLWHYGLGSLIKIFFPARFKEQALAKLAWDDHQLVPLLDDVEQLSHVLHLLRQALQLHPDLLRQWRHYKRQHDEKVRLSHVKHELELGPHACRRPGVVHQPEEPQLGHESRSCQVYQIVTSQTGTRTPQRLVVSRVYCCHWAQRIWKCSSKHF